MIKPLANWSGRVVVNGVEYGSIAEVPTIELDSSTVITLLPVVRQTIQKVTETVEHVITVKEYMTLPATPEFDFMDRWNKGVPMPLRTMVGTVEKETKGMVYMKLHGEGLPTITCMRCGRRLTNPVSRHYGLGIECIKKVGFFKIDDVTGIKEALVNLKWEGWCIKSAIIEDKIKGVDDD